MDLLAMPPMPVLANRVQERMDALGLNMKQVAARVRVHYQTIQWILNGTTKNPQCIVSLARALETTPEWLLGEEMMRNLAPDEDALVARYRRLAPDQKRAFLSILGGTPPEPPKKRLKVVR